MTFLSTNDVRGGANLTGSDSARAEAQTRTAACALQDTQQVKPRKYKTANNHQGKQLWI